MSLRRLLPNLNLRIYAPFANPNRANYRHHSAFLLVRVAAVLPVL
jgi:hypothetical protein